jgi:pyruvate dehydrogenase E2 component (dihydrolipoamide acetyltransferase)
MTLKEFRLPDIGEGIAEGEIVSWKVEVGQQVKEEDEFVEVMTDKATVMITVPFDGVIKELKYKDGDVVPVEEVIAVIDTAGAGPSGEKTDGEAKEPTAAKSEQAEQKTPKQPEPQREREAASTNGSGRSSTEEPVTIPSAPSSSFEQASPGKVMAAPATRRRAREMGVDLHAVEGTGPRGRITNEDLQAFLEQEPAAAGTATATAPERREAPAPRAPISVQTTGAEERIPFRGLRRKIAEAMARSKSTAAHFTYVDDINVTELVKLRKEAKEEFVDQGINVTYLPFIMKAVVEAMKQFPMMNSSLDESTQELVIKKHYNFGIATDTDNGLIVPVIKDVDRKTIVELAADIQEIARATREGNVPLEDLQGSTFTITNAGNIGGLFATPIINFPEVAILGVHAIKKTPVVDPDGRIVVGDVMYLSVSIDHRIVDGATGAYWMNVVKECLEQPRRLLFGRV